MIGRIEELFAKFLEFFNADCSERLGDGFAPRFVDAVDVCKFIEWHNGSR
jgi:hypothetical protein